jgi:hypothetical protein
VRDRLVAAAAELVGQRIGDAGAIVRRTRRCASRLIIPETGE